MSLRFALLTSLFTLSTVCALTAASLTAFAERGEPAATAGTFAHTIDFRHTGKAALKVTEPDGFKITVGGADHGTIPVVVELENKSDYVTVSITAKDGATFKQKIEIRRNYETVLRVSYKLPEKKEEKAAPSFIGKAQNSTNECFGKRDDLRYDFTIGGTVAAKVELDSRETKSLRIPAASYSVRIFKKDFSDYEFITAKSLKVTADGWSFDYGCKEDGDDTPR